MGEKNHQGKPFITHMVFFPDGKIDKYQKTHLGHSEKEYFAPGNELPMFQTEKIKFGIQICWELHFPEITTIVTISTKCRKTPSGSKPFAVAAGLA
ncbi:MAG: hypothetical protein KGZ96_04525 [Clostridia bacterium]|nr:hypothetical protein [Clostridia bacterium]